MIRQCHSLAGKVKRQSAARPMFVDKVEECFVTPGKRARRSQARCALNHVDGHPSRVQVPALLLHSRQTRRLRLIARRHGMKCKEKGVCRKGVMSLADSSNQLHGGGRAPCCLAHAQGIVGSEDAGITQQKDNAGKVIPTRLRTQPFAQQPIVSATYSALSICARCSLSE